MHRGWLPSSSADVRLLAVLGDEGRDTRVQVLDSFVHARVLPPPLVNHPALVESTDECTNMVLRVADLDVAATSHPFGDVREGCLEHSFLLVFALWQGAASSAGLS